MNTRPNHDPEKVLAHYQGLLEIVCALAGMEKLKELLATQRDGGPAPTYAQLAEIAYGKSKNEN
ncbi:hypothetical protein [Collimonas humicola]|uniref:hypothetical protein n=1 Tax=Collimonas humicola TaxID=2825886 RepID=UPI001B8C8B1C|nr:hypothetical protein [Collimonas humicola]